MMRQNVVDQVFSALADPTRRAIVERLSQGPSTVSDLAKPFGISLAAVMQHLKVLEQSGLARSQKIGRVRTCSIETSGLRLAEQWLEQRRSLWERRFDRLGALLDEASNEEAALDSPPSAPPKRRKS